MGMKPIVFLQIILGNIAIYLSNFYLLSSVLMNMGIVNLVVGGRTCLWGVILLLE
jgi:hypothetical protein